MDPLAELYYSISPYVYCYNNPLRFTDPTGMAPGDLFPARNAAAEDWARFYNAASIAKDKEITSLINIVKKKGTVYYTYTEGVEGRGRSVPKQKAEKNTVADIHSHASYTTDSDNEVSG